MFEPDSQKTCGSKCNSKRSKRSTTFGGWTPYYNNDDNPISGTGDHEHPFYFRDWSYRGNDAKKMHVYGKDGQAYKNCKKTAILAREKETHVQDVHEAAN